MNVLAATEAGPDRALVLAILGVGGSLSAAETGADSIGSTLMQQLMRALAGMAPGGAWPGRNTTEPPIYPYITFLRVISSSNISFDGPSDMQSTRVQVDCFGARYSDAANLMRAVEAVIVSQFVVGSIDAQDFPPDPDTLAFRVSEDFNLWSVN